MIAICLFHRLEIKIIERKKDDVFVVYVPYIYVLTFKGRNPF